MVYCFGAEKRKTIRTSFIKDDLFEAVISFAAQPVLTEPPSLPASWCCRAKGAKPKARKGKVLFINADAEYYSGRAQNYLRPEHIEKITNTYDAFQDVPGYAAVVTKTDLKEDYNLNVRRYADNAPPPEPHDVRAHLVGGVPKTEVNDASDLLTAHGFAPQGWFVDRDEDYLDFADRMTDRSQIKHTVETDPGAQDKEQAMTTAFDKWWKKHSKGLRELPENKQLMKVRSDVLNSFDDALLPVGMLDSFKLSGVVASWWADNQFELKTLVAQGFGGLIDSWVEAIRAVVDPDEDDEPDKDAADPFEHRLVTTLLPEYLAEIAEAEAAVAECNAKKEEFELGPEDEQEEEDDGPDSDDDEDEGGRAMRRNYTQRLDDERKEQKESIKDQTDRLKVLGGSASRDGSIKQAAKKGVDTSELEAERDQLKVEIAPSLARIDELEELLEPYKAIKKELSAARKLVKEKRENLLKRLEAKIAEMSDDELATLVLGMLRDDFIEMLSDYVSAHRRSLIAFGENLWDKYSTDLNSIEDDRDASAKLLTEFTKKLSYV